MNTHPRSFTRRQALALGGGIASAFGLSACDVQVSQDSPGDAPARKIKFPDPRVELPTGDVTFRWIDSGGLKKPFHQAILDSYHKKHANITTDYTGTGWATVNEVVPLGIRNKSAPDVFAMPQTVPSATAVAEGWVRPLDDLIPDFDAWMQVFPEGSFVPGSHVFNDRVYTLPLSSDRRLRQMIFYDEGLLQQADIDPENDLGSWDALRKAAKKITKQGKGKYYGMLASKKAGKYVECLATAAGWQSSSGLINFSGIDYSTGEFVYTAPEILDALEFLQALIADGSIRPGWISLDSADARSQMPNGTAGMMFEGPWNIQQWKQDAPEWKYGVVPQPPQQEGGTFTVPYQEIGVNCVWVFADTKYPNVAAELLSYIGSVEGQVQMIRLTDGNLQSIIPEAVKQGQKLDLDPIATKVTGLADKYMRRAPLVSIRNPDTTAVRLALQPVTPSFSDVIEGILTEQLTDAKAAITKVNDQLNKALDTAIAQATKKGATTTREDWVFPNWDRTADYEKSDYAELR